jgi:hypothetical protein
MPLFSPRAANRGEAEACLERAKFEAGVAERTARYAKAVKLAKKAIRLFGTPCPQEAKNLLHSLELKQKNSRPSNYRPLNEESQQTPATSTSSARQRFVNRPESQGWQEHKESSDGQQPSEDAKDSGESPRQHHQNSQPLWRYIDLPATLSFVRTNSVASYWDAFSEWFDRLPIMRESRSTIKKLIGLVLFLGLYRLFIGRLTMFSLPGDFNYASPSGYFSFPLLSGIVMVTTVQALFIIIS